MSTQIELRRARESDREFARAAHHAAYRDVVTLQFGAWDEVAQDAFFDAAWDPMAQEMILVDGERCGYTVVERRDEDVHLRELVIHPEFQGRGVGSWLLRRLQTEAAGTGVPVRLGTFRTNRAAILYRRLGFREIGSTPTHVLMEWAPGSGTGREPADSGD